MTSPKSLNLVMRRVIPASPARVFEAWTTPTQLLSWWGPDGVRCMHAEVEARVGGLYRIGNELPNGSIVWITGEFLAVDPPHRLVYSWRVAPGSPTSERVTVRFLAHESGGTEVVIVHERIADAGVRDEHERGWNGCLERLAAFV